jgi:glycosyltransferase involved in cell wall biosynthesis
LSTTAIKELSDVDVSPVTGRSDGRDSTRRSVAIFLPNLRGGGAERVAVNLANELVRRGHRVDMVLLEGDGVFRSLLAPQVRVVDLKVRRMRWALLPLVRYLRTHVPDAALACMWPLTGLVVLARELCRCNTRVVVAEHTTWSRSEQVDGWGARMRTRLLMRNLLPRADKIVAVSRGAAEDLAEFARIPRESVTVVYNPIVPNQAAARPAPTFPEQWCSGTHKRLLAVGQLKEVKDYSTLLDAFAKLRQGMDARLLILGEGDARAKLERRVSELGLHGSVFMPGFVTDPHPYFGHADLHVLSSRAEGLPTVLVEAMSAGTPIVSTDCPSGPREILDNGRFGRLVQVGDSSALADAMLTALRSPHQPAELRKRALDFKIDVAADKYERLFAFHPLSGQ